MKKIFYVYALYRERKQKPFYIGKGVGDRVDRHFRESNLRANTHKNNIIKKDLAAGKRIRIKLLAEDLTEAQAFKLEREWIAYYGREVDGTGCLTNLTDGGEGVTGHKHLPATRKKLSRASQEAWSDPARRAAQSEAARRLWQDPRARKDITANRKRTINDPEYKSAMRPRLKQAHAAPSVRQAHSDAATRRWQDPSYREAISAKRRATGKDPAFLQAQREAAKRRWQDPAYRQRIADAKAAKKMGVLRS